VSRWRAGALAPVALAAVTAAAALGLARGFADGSFAGPVLVAAAIPHAIGAAGRRARVHPAVTVLVTALAVLLWCAWVFAAGSTAYGVPTPTTLARLGDRLDAGWQVFRTGVAPVEPTRGVVMLCTAIVAGVGTVADLLAFRSRATIGALVPSLLLFVLAATLGTDDLLVVTTVAYVVAALVFLLLANQARLESRRAWASGRRLRSDASVVNAGLAVGAVAVVAGLALAPVLPGADDGPLLDYKSIGGRSGPGTGDYRTLSPLVDIRSRLLDQGDVELFRVRSPMRLAWRVAALDRFDGRIWGIESTAQDASRVLGARPDDDTVEQEFSISALDAQWLPAAYRPRSVNVDGARIIPESSTLIAPRSSIAGLRYRVRSQVPPLAPTPEQIAATDRRDFTFDRYTQLPDGFPTSVERRARAIVRGATTPYDAAKRLEEFFLDGSFTYDLRVEGGSGADAIVEFLTRRRGFCEQFAGTYAAMARAVGLPARVAVGFTAGTYDPDDDRYVVSSRNAHAWPEVWLAGLGWIAFEPTPAGPQPGQADAGLGTPTAETEPDTSPSTTATTTPGATATPPTDAAPVPGASEVSAGAPSTTDGSGSDRGVIALVIAAVALASGLALLARRVQWKRRRRAARRAAVDPAHSVAGAWQDALEHLAGAGLEPRASLTPREQARGYRDRGVPEPAADALDRLARTYSVAAWSPHRATPDDVAAAWAAADTVRDALAAEAGTVERARRSLRVPELTSR
jgi:transglutaminase-like putative cysteine protease